MQANVNKIDQERNIVVKKQWGVGPELTLIDTSAVQKGIFAPHEAGVPHPGVVGGTYTIGAYHS